MNKNNRNLILLTPALLILGAVLALAICMAEPETADAAVAIVDYDSSYVNKRAAIYTESYDYYFVLESTPEQGRKLVLSTEPFTVTCDGVQDASGAYTVELSSPGGNVYVRHFAQGQFQSYDVRYENCGSGAVLRFKYRGQDYKTNAGFSSSGGLEFNRTADMTSGVMFSMMSYLKSQDILFERYPYYIFGYNPENNRYLMYLTESDLAKAATNSYVYCFFDATEMKISGFNVVTGSPYLPNSMQSRMKAALNDITFTETTSYGARYISIYSNMTDNGEPASYFYPNPWPGYEAFTGTSVPTPAPTPTPTPAPAVRYEYNSRLGVISGVRLEQNASGWRVAYTSLNAADSVYMTALIVLPSQSYVKEHFLKAADRAELVTEETVTAWRTGTESGSAVGMYVEDVVTSTPFGFSFGNFLRQKVLDRWMDLYGNTLPKGYIEEVMTYAYPEVFAVRIQEEKGDALYNIGPLTLTYPLKYYLSYDKYGKFLEVVGGYKEYVLEENTGGMTLTQIEKRAEEKAENDEKEQNDKLVQEGLGGHVWTKEDRDKVANLDRLKPTEVPSPDLSVGGIFSMFGSLADGLTGAYSAFGNIAAAVGSAFAFLPAEITAVIGITFVSLLVIALYHALRG